MTNGAQAPTPESVDRIPAWHARTADEVLAALATSAEGLGADEVSRRLSVYGPNVLPQTRGRHPLWRFLAQFNSALIYFLLAAAAAAFLLRHFVDASVILAVVIVNAIVGFVQEGKAEKALNAIRDLIAPRASVFRDGKRTSVAAAQLVPGDIVLIEPGDRIPADLRLLHARALLIDEALLTGESVAAAKGSEPVREDAALGDRQCVAFFGTLVATGQATGIVVATGANTQIGRISSLLQSVEQLTTPLLRQINQFGRRFTWTALVGATLLFCFAVYLRNYEWPTALIAVVALAVGVVPEGLPAVITITLAIGVQRMAARNAVIRKLPAVETLGATSVICSDKTGTLTRNEMTVRRVVTAQHQVIASGAGYAPEGQLTASESDDDTAAIAAIMPLVRCGALCNDARVFQKQGQWSVEGDPMEGALCSFAMKAGLDVEHLRAEWSRLDEIPFDAAYRYMASLHRGPDGRHIVFVKGAPEHLLEMTGARAEDGTGSSNTEQWHRRIAESAAQGERVLGFASKVLERDRLSHEDVQSGLTFLGIAGFIDPPREEAIAAIAQCRAAGIKVRMITGDHAATANAIAHQLALAEDPTTLTGAQVDALDDAQLRDTVSQTAVFARTSPEHKLRIVRALQSRGSIVAMTGDGVNDAPSLKQADVGVAMGIKGTEAAKEAAEMVLLDDNFASIVNAVHEGRVVYDNIRKVIAWTLPTNGGEALTVIVAILFGFALPMSAVQILWINLILTATLGLALAFEPAERDVMRRPPRLPAAPILSPFLLWRIVLVSFLFLGVSLSVFFYSLQRGDSMEMARTLVVNMIIVLEIFYLFNVRYMHMRSITWRGALGTPAVLLAIATVVLAQLAFNYLPAMNRLFESRPVAIADGVLIVAIGFVLMLLLEGEKVLLRRFRIFDEIG